MPVVFGSYASLAGVYCAAGRSESFHLLLVCLACFALHDRPVPAKVWNEVGPDHLILSAQIQIQPSGRPSSILMG
jgi:hypothetical protein